VTAAVLLLLYLRRASARRAARRERGGRRPRLFPIPPHLFSRWREAAAGMLKYLALKLGVLANNCSAVLRSEQRHAG